MQLIGVIKQVQIQRENLKLGHKPDRTYHTAPLLVVDALQLTAGGVLGLMDDGGTLIDVHHIDHPGSRNRENANGISFNITGHYAQIRARFGDHMLDGAAGENILIERADGIRLDEIGEIIVIEDAVTGALSRLHGVMVADPCVEFSHFALCERAGGTVLRDTLQFLGDGMRGFYATLTPGQSNITIRAGDRVYSQQSS